MVDSDGRRQSLVGSTVLWVLVMVVRCGWAGWLVYPLSHVSLLWFVYL